MTTRHADRFGLTRSRLWILAVALTLVVRPALADEAAKAEAQRLAAELRKSQAQVAALEAENKKLRAELTDEQLKNAIDVDQEIKRLRDLLRGAPERIALGEALLKAKEEKASLAKDIAREFAAERGALLEQLNDEKAREKQQQAEIDRLSDDLLKRSAENRTLEERLVKLIEQVAAVRKELATLQPTPKVEPKPEPKTEPKPEGDGPTKEQLNRLADELKRRIDPKPVDDEPTKEQLKRLADELRRREEAARQDALQARDLAERARLEADRARREAEERERVARANAPTPNADPARIEAEVRAAKLEAQLHVMQMAYTDLRKEANRLREELDAERKARGAAVDPNVQQRLNNLEAVVTKLSMVVEQLMKKAEQKNP